MKPFVGAIVHLNHNSGLCRAAIVTRVNADSTAELTVFPSRPGQVLGENNVEQDAAKKKKDTWHWPCDREEAV